MPGGWTQIMREAPVAVVSRPWISLKSRFSPAAVRFARYRVASNEVAGLADRRAPADERGLLEPLAEVQLEIDCLHDHAETCHAAGRSAPGSAWPKSRC